jgi:dTMP kinase
MTFLLDCPISVGLIRARKRIQASGEENQDRFEKEGSDFHEAIRKGYLLAASEARDRFVVLDGTQSEDQLEALVFAQVEPHVRRYLGQE